MHAQSGKGLLLAGAEVDLQDGSRAPRVREVVLDLLNAGAAAPRATSSSRAPPLQRGARQMEAVRRDAERRRRHARSERFHSVTILFLMYSCVLLLVLLVRTCLPRAAPGWGLPS